MNARSDGTDPLYELADAACSRRVRVGVGHPGVLIPQQVQLFVEHGLKVALAAVVEHEPPVGTSSPAAATSVAEWRSMEITAGRFEQAPEGFGDGDREPPPRCIRSTDWKTHRRARVASTAGEPSAISVTSSAR